MKGFRRGGRSAAKEGTTLEQKELKRKKIENEKERGVIAGKRRRKLKNYEMGKRGCNSREEEERDEESRRAGRREIRKGPSQYRRRLHVVMQMSLNPKRASAE